MSRLLLILLLCAPFARAEERIHQFLLVVDTSQSMRSREESLVRTVRALVQSGFNGQIEEGDIFGIWTFTSELHTNRFPAHLWEPRRRALHAEMAVQFISEEKFLGRTEFRSTAEELSRWVARQENALVLLISDGEDQIVGIPNDIEINNYIIPRRARARAAKRVFLISMLVRQGRITEWVGYEGLGKLDLPLLPVREKEEPVVAAAAPVAPVVTPEEPPPAPVIELPPGAKIVAVDPPKPAEVTTPTPDPVQTTVESKPVDEELIKEKEPGVARKEEPVPTQTEPAKAEPPPKKEDVAQAEPISIASTNQPTSKVSTNREPSVATVMSPAPRKPIYFVVGALMVLIPVLLVLLLRKRRPAEHASLISKSFSQK
jgi:hypothetical protein